MPCSKNRGQRSMSPNHLAKEDLMGIAEIEKQFGVKATLQVKVFLFDLFFLRTTHE